MLSTILFNRFVLMNKIPELYEWIGLWCGFEWRWFLLKIVSIIDCIDLGECDWVDIWKWFESDMLGIKLVEYLNEWVYDNIQ